MPENHEYQLVFTKLFEVGQLVLGLHVNDCPTEIFNEKILDATAQNPGLYPGDDRNSWAAVMKLQLLPWWSRLGSFKKAPAIRG